MSRKSVTPPSVPGRELAVGELVVALGHRRQRVEVAAEDAVRSPTRSGAPRDDDVDVGRDGEDGPRLLEPAEVGQRQHDDERRGTARPGTAAGPRTAEVMAATPAEIDTATVST